jgi:adenine phosphoribosyltransferase
MDLKATIRDIPDFPRKGIVFRDITTLLKNPDAFHQALDEMQSFCESKPIDHIVGIESRGFIFGAALADRMHLGFVPVRKKGKLPAETVSYDYALEYGTDTIEIHADALNQGDSVVIVDDLLATGGTMQAACKLVEKAGAKVAGIAVLVDLAYLPWRDKIDVEDILTLVRYDSE